MEPINNFISTLGVEGFDHAVDSDGVVWANYGIVTQPAFVFVNDDGTLETHMGALGVDGLIEAIKNLKAA